jgi:hypothetical protein
MAEHGRGPIPVGSWKHEDRGLRPDVTERITVLGARDRRQLRLINSQAFLEPGEPCNEPALRMVVTRSGVLKKRRKGRFKLGLRICLPIGREKKPGIVDEALSSRTRAFIVDQDVPVSFTGEIRLPRLFDERPQITRGFLRACMAREGEKEHCDKDKKKVYGASRSVYQ